MLAKAINPLCSLLLQLIHTPLPKALQFSFISKFKHLWYKSSMIPEARKQLPVTKTNAIWDIFLCPNPETQQYRILLKNIVPTWINGEPRQNLLFQKLMGIKKNTRKTLVSLSCLKPFADLYSANVYVSRGGMTVGNSWQLPHSKDKIMSVWCHLFLLHR